MRKIALVVFILGMALLLGSAPGWAVEEGMGTEGEITGAPEGSTTPASEEERPTIGADLGFYSAYIWRGFALSNNSIVVQPSITAGYRGFGMNLWGNLDTDFDDGNPMTDDKKEWTETDFTLSYDRSFGPINAGVGYIYYGLDGIDDSEEFYVSIGADVILAPTFTVYREFAHYPGWYFLFGISHSFELPNGWSLDLGASGSYYAYDDDAMVEIDDFGNATMKKYKNFHDGVVSAGLTIPVGKYFTIAPTLSYSFPLSHEADNFIAAGSMDNKSDHLYGGINFSMAF